MSAQTMSPLVMSTRTRSATSSTVNPLVEHSALLRTVHAAIFGGLTVALSGGRS